HPEAPLRAARPASAGLAAAGRPNRHNSCQESLLRVGKVGPGGVAGTQRAVVAAVRAAACARVGDWNMSELRKDSLSFIEALGQSVANVSPTLTPALAVAVVAGMAGTAS